MVLRAIVRAATARASILVARNTLQVNLTIRFNQKQLLIIVLLPKKAVLRLAVT